MRFFIIFLISISVCFGVEKKVSLAAYANFNQAKNALIKLEPKFSKDFQNLLTEKQALIKARKSGKMYIIVVEPLADYKSAKKIKSLLPKPYNRKSLISNFSKSTNTNAFKLTFNADVPKEQKLVEQKPVEPKEDIKKQTDVLVHQMEKEDDVKNPDFKSPQSTTIPQDENQSTVTNDVEIHIVKEDIKEVKPAEPKEDINKTKPIRQEDIKIDDGTKDLSLNRHMDNVNSNKQLTYSDIILGTIKNIFMFFWDFFEGFFSAITGFIKEYQFLISLSILLISAIGIFVALKKKDDMAEELDILQKHLEEKAILVESIQIEMNHLKTYYNKFTSSVTESMKILNKYFNKMEKECDISPEVMEAMQSITTVLNSHEEFSGDIFLDNAEFNLNQLVGNIIKLEQQKLEKNISIVVDFNLPILERVMGDNARLSRVFLLLLDFMCTYTPQGRVIISLLETTMNVDSIARISVSLKGNKNGLNDRIVKKIEQALISSKFSEQEDPDIKKLIVAKRLLNIMEGDLKFSGGYGQESTFFFDFELRVMNRYSLKDISYFRDSVINLSTTILGKNDETTQKLKSDLNSFNIEPTIYKKWTNFYNMQLQDTYSFIDLVIVDYNSLEDIQMQTLIEQALYKNFSLLIITNKSLGDDIKSIIDEKYHTLLKNIYTRALVDTYTIDDLKQTLIAIRNQQKPADSSHAI